MENNNLIPKFVEEKVKQENEKTVKIFEEKNQSYQLLSGILPIVNKVAAFFLAEGNLDYDTEKVLLKSIIEAAAYLEHCSFRHDFFQQNYQNLILKSKEAPDETWRKETKELILAMQENMILALEEAEQQRHICCCCGAKNFFIPLTKYYDYMQEYYGAIPWRHETQNGEDAVCPACGSFDRERLLILALQREELKEKKILQIAPSNAVDMFLKQEDNAGYDTCDLFMEEVTFQADLQNMDMVETESYDIFLCSHVLEHVQDDKKAMAELYRITKQGGYGLLLVPLDLNQKETDEEWGRPVEECWKRFGQDDHTRKYAKNDFIKRLQESGFEVEELNQDFFGKEVFEINALSGTSVLYKVKKPEISLRKATMEDMDLLYEWANEEEVRKNAFHTEKISYDTHKRWLENILKDTTVLQYIMVQKNNEGKEIKEIGQIRLEIKEGSAIISYSIAKSIRKQGFGVRIIELAENELKKTNREVFSLIGKVKYNNAVSRKVFEKCGYSECLKENYVEYKKQIR